MNKLALIPVAIAVTLFASCGKQQTEAEKNAEIERQVQQRLDAQHQTEAQQQLAAREADLAAREKALADQQNATAETPALETPAPRNEPAAEENSDSSGDVSTNENASYDTFYSKLDPYGDWRETADYGYVFQPRAAEGSRKWRPYTSGRWVYTEAGWTWVSEEPFGWATYHYGRWTRLRNIGWVWVPGDEWAPAWVSWRKSDDYVGWAPLPPEATFDRRAGIHQWADNYYDLGPEEYAFVSTNEFGSQRIEQTVVPQERNVTIVSQTTNVTNITYNNTTVVNQGPNYEDLSRRSRQPIARLRLERGAQFEGDNPRAIVRGEVIAMPAPFIAPAQRRGRPTRVKEAIRDAVVDRGVVEIADRPAVENARAKMRAESTPPAGLPPKKFIKPAIATVPIPPRPGTNPTPIQNFPDDHRKELDQQRLRREAQRRADEERKMKQMGRPMHTPAAPPVSTPATFVSPTAASPAGATHTPLPAATIMPPRKPVRDAGKQPLPNESVPKQAATITPPIATPPVRIKAPPSPVPIIAPSAPVPPRKPVRDVTKQPSPTASVPKQAPTNAPPIPTPPARAKVAPSPFATAPIEKPVQKRAPISPSPRATPPSPIVTPPPVNDTGTSPSPAAGKQAKGKGGNKAAPKSQPSATASPGDDGKGPGEKK
jgi:hypothetical protein